jgi:hypothetical protein
LPHNSPQFRTLRTGRALRAPKVTIRKVVNLAPPEAPIERAAAVYRTIVSLTAEAIEADLQTWIRRAARPDALRLDATRTRDPYPGDLAGVLRRVRSQFQERGLLGLLDDVAKAVDENSFDKLKRVPGIDPSRIVPGGAMAIERFRQVNAGLITSVPVDMAADIGATLAQADVAKMHVTEVGELLSERFGVAESKGEFWARDQTLKLYANIQETRQRAAGAARYQWEHSDDERVRGRPDGIWAKNGSDHWSLGNTIHEWSTPPITNARTGARNHPGNDFQCRCSAYPLFDGDPIDVEPPDL